MGILYLQKASYEQTLILEEFYETGKKEQVFRNTCNAACIRNDAYRVR
jgi:hypothetical protein